MREKWGDDRGGRGVRVKGQGKINNDTSVWLCVSTSKQVALQRQVSRLESKDWAYFYHPAQPTNIHQQDTESQVSHLFAPSSSCPWWSEVNSEEVFCVSSTDTATHVHREETQGAVTDLRGLGEIRLEGVGELWHRRILGEQQANASPLFLITIFLFSSKLLYRNILFSFENWIVLANVTTNNMSYEVPFQVDCGLIYQLDLYFFSI